MVEVWLLWYCLMTLFTGVWLFSVTSRYERKAIAGRMTILIVFWPITFGILIYSFIVDVVLPRVKR